MHSMFLVFAASALFIAHVARGFPADPSSPPASPPPATGAPQASGAPQAEVKDTCEGNVNGTSRTFKVGERYCSSGKTHRVCNWGGEWIDGECPEGYHCLTHTGLWQVLCRTYIRHPYPTGPPAGQEGGAEPVPASQPSPSQPEPSKPEQPSQPSQPEPSKPEQPSQPSQPEPSKPEQPSQPSQPEPSKPEQPEPSMPSEPSQPSQSSEPAKPAQPTGSETCQAGGKTLKVGDAACTGQNSYVQCDNGGKNLERTCESGFECLPSGNGVICSNRNQIQKNRNQEPKDNQPSQPSQPEPSKPEQPSQPSQPEPSKPEQPSQPSQPEPSKPEQPEPSKPEQPESSKPSEPSQPSQSSEPAKPEPASQPAQPTGSETCQAGGKTLKLGDATCTGQNSYVQCDHGGKNLERTCESGFECLPSGNGVICSNRNQILKNRNQEPKNNQH